MKDIDYRLDFYNAVKEFNDNRTEHDSYLVITSCKKDNTFTYAMGGEKNDIINVILNLRENSDNSEDSIDAYDDLKAIILDSAFNILNDNKDMKDVFIGALNGSIKLPSVKV